MLLLFVFALGGCQVGSGSEGSAPVPQNTAIRGRAKGGQQPVVGAAVQMYAAGSTGIGSTASPLLSAPATTDSLGNFNIDTYTCPTPDTQVYLVATGGSPGLPSGATNPSLTMMAALGPCSAVTSSTFANINEVTTVASVWALAPWMKSATLVGSDSATQAQMASAFALVSEFANTALGSAPGPALPTWATVPVAKINTLADIFAACINSTGGRAGDGSLCGSLFSLATYTSVPPTTVVDAALGIANHPTSNVASIYGLTPSMPAFQPALAAAPSDWTISVSSPVATPVITPPGGSINGTQLVTITDSTASSVIHYTTDGTLPSSSSPVYTAPLSINGTVRIQAAAYLIGAASNVATATFVASPQNSYNLIFTREPGNSMFGTPISPAVVLQVQDAQGALVGSASNPVTLRLVGGTAGARLTGTLQTTPTSGVANFSDLQINLPGDSYTLVASANGMADVSSAPFAIEPAGTSQTLVPPAPNTCTSNFDTFYSTEPGVYDYWPLCETSSPAVFYDYVGRNDLNHSTGGWSSGSFSTGVSGPVADLEGAVQVRSASAFYAAQNVVLNTNAGTVAIWANTTTDQWLNSMISFEAVNGKSNIWLAALAPSGNQCFQGKWTNSAGTAVLTPSACGYAPNTWHRVVMTWSLGTMALYVDGVKTGSSSYTGTLDPSVFVYRMFPQSIDNGLQMTLAKAVLANQAWTPTQVAADYAPTFVTPPAGGVYVTAQKMGTVHRDVLGYADMTSISSPGAARDSLIAGLSKAGVTSLRYANGDSGIGADLSNWQGATTGLNCTATKGATQPATNSATQDTTDVYIPNVAKPLGLTLGYTVNYGTNPPYCNAGGDPIQNGANLVQYLNKNKGYGFKYFEIGNELYNGGGSEPDFHAKPGDGASYGPNEKAFASAMKNVDSSIQIGIPIGMDHVYSWLNDWSLAAMANSQFDAAIYHNYPTIDPVTDGATLYPERVASGQGTTKGDLLSLQTMLLNFGKSPEAIWVTEWNDNANGGGPWSRQALGGASPLFAAIWLSEYMNAGVQWATWFGQYGVTNYCNPFNYDGQGESAYSTIDNCGGSFLVYTGPIQGENLVGFKPGDLSPVGHAFELLSQSGFVTEGEHMLRTYSDGKASPWLLSYAATHGSSYAVILINRDRDAAHTVPVQFAGKTSGQSVTRWTYGREQYDLSASGNWSQDPVQSTDTGWSGSYKATLPPWSVNVFMFGN